MIIEDETKSKNCAIRVECNSGDLLLRQYYEAVVIDKQQATQLIELLTKWVATGEVE